MTRLGLVVPFVLAVVVAGCGSSSSSSSSGSGATGTSSSSSKPAAAAGTTSSALTLSESEFKITPSSPNVAHPGRITIDVKNTGKVTHVLTVQTPSGPVSTGSIAPGASATLNVNATKAGQYKFFCPIPGHAQAGMKGVLVVGGSASASSSSGTTAVSSSGGGGAPYKSSGY